MRFEKLDDSRGELSPESLGTSLRLGRLIIIIHCAIALIYLHGADQDMEIARARA